MIKGFSYPLLFDTKDVFYKGNNFLRPDLAHQAVLLAANNIIATGSPIYSEKIKAKYLEKIRGK